MNTASNSSSAAAAPSPHKASLSLFPVLGSALLVAFLIIVGAGLWSQYRLTNQIIDNEVSNTVAQNHALLQAVLSGELGAIRSQMEMLSKQEELALREPDAGLNNLNHALQRLVSQQNQATGSDFILLGDVAGQRCHNSRLSASSTPLTCERLIQQFDSDLFDWHLAILETDGQPILSLLTRVPVIATGGKVLAYIYGGTNLTGNFSIINQTLSSEFQQTVAVGIAFNDQLIAASTTPDSAAYLALQQAARQPTAKSQILPKGLIGTSRRILLEHAHELDVRLVSVIRTKGLRQLQQGLIQQSSSMLILAIALAVIIVLLTLRLTLTPLSRLHRWAKQPHNTGPGPFNPGPISEFQQLSSEIARILSRLQRTEQQLTDKGKMLELSHQEQKALADRNRKLLHQLFNLQELERKQLAQELHDELGQPLAVINTDAYLIKTASDPASKTHQCALSIQQNTSDMSDVVYHRIKSLRPMPLNDLGLIEAIRHMPALDNLEHSGIPVEVSLPEQLPPLPEQTEIHLFRIVQEGLTNILKHSQADRAWLRLSLLCESKTTTDANTLTLDIADNGCGFTPPKADDPKGFGINGMIERVNAMGGALELNSDDGNGCRIRIKLALCPESSNPPEVNWQI